MPRGVPPGGAQDGGSVTTHGQGGAGYERGVRDVQGVDAARKSGPQHPRQGVRRGSPGQGSSAQKKEVKGKGKG